MFCGAEVKRAGGDELESVAQLALWMAAGLRKSCSLRLCADGEHEDGAQTTAAPTVCDHLGQSPMH